MRKIKSREYCHNCEKYSMWEFEDREGNQIIECPVCSHLHYRIIGGATIDFEIEFRGEKVRDMNRVRQIIEQFPETKQEMEQMFATLEFGTLEDAAKLQVTDQRWGVDASQGWAISSTMTASYTTWFASTSSYVVYN